MLWQQQTLQQWQDTNAMKTVMKQNNNMTERVEQQQYTQHLMQDKVNEKQWQSQGQ